MLAIAFGLEHASLAYGALAASAIPIIIHLIHRRSSRRQPWAAMRFLQAAYQRQRHRIFLQHWLLLLMRIAAILLIGLAAASPVLREARGIPRLSPAHHILVLDQSLSSRAKTAEGVVMDRIRRIALDLVAGAAPGDWISVIAMGDPAAPLLEEPVRDADLARQAIERTMPGYGRADWEGAFKLVEAHLKRSEVPKANRVVHLIGDQSAVMWSQEGGPGQAVEACRQLEALAQIVVIAIAPPTGENAFIAQCRIEQPLDPLVIPVTIEVIAPPVKDAGDDRHLEFVEEGKVLRSIPLPTPVGEGRIRMTAKLGLATSGNHRIEARLVGAKDALEEDDGFFLVAEAGEKRGVLLVDGEPGPRFIDGEAGYLAAALAPRISTRREDLFEPVMISDFELDSVDFRDVRVVALCNVRGPSTETWNRLSEFVGAGGGLLIAAGGRLIPDAYMNDPKARGLLPGQLAKEPGQADPPRQLDPKWLGHPSLKEFEQFTESGVFRARFDRWWPIEPDADAAVVLRLEGGEPLLVTRAYGRGMTAFWGSSLNMAWNNLPSKGDFVSLMTQIVGLLSTPFEGRLGLRVGDRLTEWADGDEEVRPTLEGPEGLRLGVVRVMREDGQGWTFESDPIDRPGFWRLQRAEGAIDLAVNSPSEESDLRVVDKETLKAWLGEKAIVVDETAPLTSEDRFQRASQLARQILAALLVLLFGESVLAWQMGRGR